MFFRIGRDGNIKIGDFFKPRNQIGGIGITLGMRLIALAPHRRISPQGDNMANAGLPVIPRHRVYLLARGADAGKMRCGRERGFL